jgi:hypothetical protein
MKEASSSDQLNCFRSRPGLMKKRMTRTIAVTNKKTKNEDKKSSALSSDR